MKPRLSRAAKRIVLVAALALVCAGAPPLRAQSSSANFILQRSTANAAGDATSSTSYVLTGSLGQESTVGASSAGSSYVLQSGFWSFAGSGFVPVFLFVSRNAVTTGNLDLAWSGNSAPYEIFRSDDCAGVLASPFDTTSSNDYANISPLPPQLECFNVMATAPGSAPAPGGAP